MSKFADQLIKSTKFSKEFSPRNQIETELRERRVFKERTSRTQFFNKRNPINVYIRILNKEGKYQFDFED